MHEEQLDRVYNFLIESIRDKGICPTKKEIAQHCGMRLETVAEALSLLEVRGKIECEAGKQRAIKLLQV